MKFILAILIISSLFTNCTTYNFYQTTGRSNVYADELVTAPQGYIPEKTIVVVKGKLKKRNYVKYFGGNAWLNMDSTVFVIKSNKKTFIYYQDETHQSSSSSSLSSSSSGGGSVQVKGYYRKDGTYVKPHTRSAPRRH